MEILRNEEKIMGERVISSPMKSNSLIDYAKGLI